MPSSISEQTRIREILTQAGVIDAEGWSRAKEIQLRKGGSLGKAVAGLGIAKEGAVADAIARGLHLDHLTSIPTAVDPKVISAVPAKFCREHMVVPLSFEGSSLRLATYDPLDYSTIQDVEFLTGRKVQVVVSTQSLIQTLMDSLFPKVAKTEIDYETLANVTPEGEVEEAYAPEYEIVNATQLLKDTKLPPIIRLVNLILSDAAKAEASDIHVEPQESYLQVRHRIDGQLHDVMRIPKELQGSTVSRLKIISGMDIADRLRPQDGKCRLRLEGKRIDLRVSSLPTQFGEKVVIRILDTGKAQLPLDQLTLTPENLRTLQTALSRPQGMILVTGPTGAGKTSTLYASLNWVKSSKTNIITVEDPIEYQLPGVNQVQMNVKAGMTFAAGLRSILRQDPDVIMVGEIRDRETASIAVEAAQTGHLLLSTLHTNDAVATVARLLDLGVEPFAIASALLAVVAQRLVRRLCPECAVPQEPSADAIARAGGPGRLPPNTRWLGSRGCEKCNQTGYKGRLAIHEILPVNEDMRALIARHPPEHELRQAARTAGMKTMMEDGLIKAAQGLTNLEELVRVVSADDSAAPAARPEQLPRRTPIEVIRPTAPSAKVRVLVVEDSPTVVTVIRYFMELEGFEVLAASDGKAGLEMARRELPSVIVSDINMPRMDGLTMLEELRADPRTTSIAVLLLTSESSAECEASSLEAGADDYMVKPVEPRRLAARVKALLSRPRLSLPVLPSSSRASSTADSINQEYTA